MYKHNYGDLLLRRSFVVVGNVSREKESYPGVFVGVNNDVFGERKSGGVCGGGRDGGVELREARDSTVGVLNDVKAVVGVYRV